MLSGILSPAFLQAAGRAGKGIPMGKIILDTQFADPTISNISCTGEIKVTTVKNGAQLVETYSDLNGETLSIQADANTQIVISGAEITACEIGYNTTYTKISVKNTALTQLNCNSCHALTALDVSNNTALTQLNCNSCHALTALDVSKNTALTQLDCGSCTKLISISYPATNEDVSTAVAGAITNADAADGTVYTDSAATYYNAIATAATTKGWTIAQISE